MAKDRYVHLRTTMGEELFQKVLAAKLLVVGAGGIGCELLKNLVLSGFRKIEVVDLDTIDVSNLNRQFFFRPKHVGQSKAEVAAEVVRSLNPDADIVAHHGNVKEAVFGLNYIGKFDMVLNALDNVDARRHVNRLCLAKGVPLIESGTTGYLGQVTVIKKGETECYECQPKATQKQYPICTIRSTPDKPVHCIVWAKECFKLYLGDAAASMLYEDPRADEPSVYMADVMARPAEGAAVADILQYATKAIQGQFVHEIKKKLAIDIYKGASRVPEPLDAAAVERLAAEYEQAPSKAKAAGWDRREWTMEDSVRELAACLVDVFGTPEQRALVGKLEFDKDDRLAMRFVTAACNLRSKVFHIPPQSLYAAKGIAGNIVPAIATTNAIIAGLQVIEALKVTGKNYSVLEARKPLKEACKYVYCLRETTRKGLLLQPVTLAPPRPDCFVCNTAQLELHIDVGAETLGDLVTRVLKGRLGVNEPSVGIGASMVYEEGDGADDSLRVNLSKLLRDLPAGGVRDGTQLSVEDFSQDLSFAVNVYQREFDPEKVPEGFEIAGAAPGARPDPMPEADTGAAAGAGATAVAAPAAVAALAAENGAPNGSAAGSVTKGVAAAAGAAAAEEEEDGSFVVVLNADRQKRAREGGGGHKGGNPGKRRAVAVDPQQDIVEIDDD